MQVILTDKLITNVVDFTGLSIEGSWIAVGSQIPIKPYTAGLIYFTSAGRIPVLQLAAFFYLLRSVLVEHYYFPPPLFVANRERCSRPSGEVEDAQLRCHLLESLSQPRSLTSIVRFQCGRQFNLFCFSITKFNLNRYEHVLVIIRLVH